MTGAHDEAVGNCSVRQGFQIDGRKGLPAAARHNHDEITVAAWRLQVWFVGMAVHPRRFVGLLVTGVVVVSKVAGRVVRRHVMLRHQCSGSIVKLSG